MDRDEFWKLISDVNDACAKPLDEARLNDSFETRWPEFDEAFKRIKFESEAKGVAVKTETERLARIEDVLEAILKSNNQTSETLTKADSDHIET